MSSVENGIREVINEFNPFTDSRKEGVAEDGRKTRKRKPNNLVLYRRIDDITVSMYRVRTSMNYVFVVELRYYAHRIVLGVGNNPNEALKDAQARLGKESRYREIITRVFRGEGHVN